MRIGRAAAMISRVNWISWRLACGSERRFSWTVHDRSAHREADAVTEIGERRDLAELLDDAGEHLAPPLGVVRSDL